MIAGARNEAIVEKLLAFVMGCHCRLGTKSKLIVLDGQEDVLRLIFGILEEDAAEALHRYLKRLDLMALDSDDLRLEQGW